MNPTEATSFAEWILNRGVPGVLIAVVFALAWVIIYLERRYNKLIAEQAAQLAQVQKAHAEQLKEYQDSLEESTDEHMTDLKNFTESSGKGADRVYEAINDLSKIAEIFERARRR